MITLTFPDWIIPTAIMLAVWFGLYARSDNNMFGHKYLNLIEIVIGLIATIIIWIAYYFLRIT